MFAWSLRTVFLQIRRKVLPMDLILSLRLNPSRLLGRFAPFCEQSSSLSLQGDDPPRSPNLDLESPTLTNPSNLSSMRSVAQEELRVVFAEPYSVKRKQVKFKTYPNYKFGTPNTFKTIRKTSTPEPCEGEVLRVVNAESKSDTVPDQPEELPTSPTLLSSDKVRKDAVSKDSSQMMGSEENATASKKQRIRSSKTQATPTSTDAATGPSGELPPEEAIDCKVVGTSPPI